MRPIFCRGVTRPARGSKLTLLSLRFSRFARTVDGYHPSTHFHIQHSTAPLTRTLRPIFTFYRPCGAVAWGGSCRAALPFAAAGSGPENVWQQRRAQCCRAARLLASLRFPEVPRQAQCKRNIVRLQHTVVGLRLTDDIRLPSTAWREA